MSIEVQERQKFKVGDWVQIVGPSNIDDRSRVGEKAEITGISPRSGNAWVKTAESPQYYPASSLTHAHPPTITLKPGDYAATVAEDGTLTLTPVQEKAEEVKREPKQGEVWRWNNNLLFITDENKAVHIGVDLYGVQFHEATRLISWDTATYAYPTLRAAAEAGVL